MFSGALNIWIWQTELSSYPCVHVHLWVHVCALPHGYGFACTFVFISCICSCVFVHICGAAHCASARVRVHTCLYESCARAYSNVTVRLLAPLCNLCFSARVCAVCSTCTPTHGMHAGARRRRRPPPPALPLQGVDRRQQLGGQFLFPVTL